MYWLRRYYRGGLSKNAVSTETLKSPLVMKTSPNLYIGETFRTKHEQPMEQPSDNKRRREPHGSVGFSREQDCSIQEREPMIEDANWVEEPDEDWRESLDW